MSMSTTVISDMLALARERADKWALEVCPVLPDVTKINDRVAVGTYSLTGTKKRWALRDALLQIDWGAPQQTPAEVARDYLKVAYPGRLRAFKEQAQAFISERGNPIYYQPSAGKHFRYIDLKGAYWQLMNVLGWDVDYHPGQWLSPGRAPYDFPAPNHKQSRSALVTVCQPGTVTIWNRGKFHEERVSGKVNQAIMRAINDILHLIALDAVTMGAVYVNTDGYIFPAERSAPFEDRLTKRWRLKWEIKAEGEGIVTGIGSYRVGERITKRYSTIVHEPMSNVTIPPGMEMLRKTFYAIAKDRIDHPGLFRR